MKKFPRIMYDQTQFTPVYFFDKNGAWLDDKSYFLMKKESGYAPDKWYLYTQCKPKAFWFGAYDEKALQSEAEFGFKNFLNEKFFIKFESRAENIYEITRKIATEYLNNFYHRELEYIISRKNETIDLLNKIRDACSSANGYYLLTQPQRLTIIEEKINQGKQSDELKFIAGLGRRITCLSEIDRDIIFYADGIMRAKCSMGKYNLEHRKSFENISSRINNYGFLGWGFYGGELIDWDYLSRKTSSLLADPRKLQKEKVESQYLEKELKKRKYLIEKNRNRTEYKLADIAGHLAVIRYDMNTYVLCLLNYIKVILDKLSEYYQIPKEDLSAYEFEEIIRLINK